MKNKTKQMSRRDLLKAGAAVTTVAWAAQNSRSFAAGSDKMGVALIGCGSQGRVLATAAVKIPNIRFKAICDIWKYSQKYMKGILKKYKHMVNVYEDYKEMLAKEDIDVVECHDATAYAELHETEELGFCKQGEGGILAESGETQIGGKIPVNTSGGLLSRGHPIGASGLAQIHELVTQLRGEAGKRQVEGAKIALAQNGGGSIGPGTAAMCIHIFEKK